METNPLSETAVFVCSHIFKNSKPVNLVIRTEGDLQMLCSLVPGAEIPHIVGLDHLLKRDPSLRDALDIPESWKAERDQSCDMWRKKPC